jgi:hypothetical protein
VAILLIFLPIIGGILVEIVSGSLLLSLAMFAFYGLLHFEVFDITERVKKRWARVHRVSVRTNEAQETEDRVNRWRITTAILFLISGVLFLVFWLSNLSLPDLSTVQPITADDWAFRGGFLFMFLGFGEGCLIGAIDANPMSNLTFRIDNATRRFVTIGRDISVMLGICVMLTFYLNELVLYYVFYTAHTLVVDVFSVAYLISLILSPVGGVITLAMIAPFIPELPKRLSRFGIVAFGSPVFVLLVYALLHFLWGVTA